ncbi:CASP7 [Bugula neritina]|uniref:CASP7 n=1 Tax=Bugula neritina TaxID=10212 RepID=A0A7J7J9T9_BUGNE|nr:CASP7 [Bugula neritina]
MLSYVCQYFISFLYTGYLAWRSNSQGSWFIQTFCKVMRRHGKSHEIHQLLTRVNQIVSYTYSTNSNGNGHSLSKQSPCFTSTLTKSLTFT